MEERDATYRPHIYICSSLRPKKQLHTQNLTPGSSECDAAWEFSGNHSKRKKEKKKKEKKRKKIKSVDSTAEKNPYYPVPKKVTNSVPTRVPTEQHKACNSRSINIQMSADTAALFELFQ